MSRTCGYCAKFLKWLLQVSQVSSKSAQDHPESVGKWYWGLLESIQIKVDIGMAEWGLL